MKSKNTTSTFLVFIILVVVCVGLNYAGYVFLKRANLKIITETESLKSAEKKSAELFGKGDNDIRAQIAELNSRIINSDQAIDLIENIEKLAKEESVELEISSVAIDPPVDPEIKTLTENLRVRFEASGSWQKINEMIFYLEHLPYRVSFENVALSRVFSKEDTESSTGLLSWRLRGELLVLKEKI